MKIRNACLVLVLSYCSYPAFSNAASFDCTKAKGYVELTICSTPEISYLDEQLNSAYKQAMEAKSIDSNIIKKAQLTWLKDIRNKTTNASSLKKVYVDRINDLNMMIPSIDVLSNSTIVQPQPQPQPQQVKSETAINQDFKKGVDEFFTKYLSYNTLDMNVDFDDFNNQVQYLFKTTGIKVDYTNKRKAYTYKLGPGMSLLALVNIESNKVNYVGMMYNSHEGNSLDSFIISNIKVSMVLQGTTEPHDVMPFLTKLAENSDGEAVLDGNKYRTANKNGAYVFIVRKD